MIHMIFRSSAIFFNTDNFENSPTRKTKTKLIPAKFLQVYQYVGSPKKIKLEPKTLQVYQYVGSRVLEHGVSRAKRFLWGQGAAIVESRPASAPFALQAKGDGKGNVNELLLPIDKQAGSGSSYGPQVISNQIDSVFIADARHHVIHRLMPNSTLVDWPSRFKTICGQWGRAGFFDSGPLRSRLNRPLGLSYSKRKFCGGIFFAKKGDRGEISSDLIEAESEVKAVRFAWETGLAVLYQYASSDSFELWTQTRIGASSWSGTRGVEHHARVGSGRRTWPWTEQQEAVLVPLAESRFNLVDDRPL
jgi:hypothetical protein